VEERDDGEYEYIGRNYLLAIAKSNDEGIIKTPTYSPRTTVHF